MLEKSIENFKREYKATPMAFLGALIGVLSLILNTSFLSFFYESIEIGVFKSDLMFVVRIALFFITQGAIFSILVWLKTSVTAMGGGFPFAIMLALCVFSAGISEISAYAFSYHGIEDKILSSRLFAFSSIVSIFFMVYFVIVQFRERYRMLPLLCPKNIRVNEKGYWRRRMIFCLIFSLFSQFSFMTYFIKTYFENTK